MTSDVYQFVSHIHSSDSFRVYGSSYCGLELVIFECRFSIGDTVQRGQEMEKHMNLKLSDVKKTF